MLKNKGCCSLELAKEIKKLGVVQKSIWIWGFQEGNPLIFIKDSWFLLPSNDKNYISKIRYSAFSVAELGELLKDYLDEYNYTFYFEGEFVIQSNYFEGEFIAKTEADTRAKMLICLIKNDSVKVEDLNKLLEG